MGSEGSRLAESERGVWCWLNRHSILCTPRCNKKNELVLFRGRKPCLTNPKYWSPGTDAWETSAPLEYLSPNREILTLKHKTHFA